MKIRVPLSYRRVLGIECPWPLILVQVMDRHGTFATIPFIVDTAADFSTIPISLATRQGIPFSRVKEGHAAGIGGKAKKYLDSIRVRIAGRDYTWPCDFIEDPPPTETGDLPMPVLGRAGFLDDFAASLDDGYLTITRLGPLRHWWHRILHRFWSRLGLLHDPEKSL